MSKAAKSEKDSKKSLEKEKLDQEAERTKSLSFSLKLLLAAALFAGALTIYGFRRGLTFEAGTRLSLPSLSSESVELPAPLADRALPLEELHEQLDGANLDHARAHVSLYSAGRLRGASWGKAKGLKGAISDAYQQAHGPSAGTVDLAILVIPTDRRQVHVGATGRHFSNVHRGIRGVSIISADDEYLLSPTHSIAANRDISEELKLEANKRKLTLDEWIAKSTAHSFSTRSFYIPLSGGEKAQEILRGNQVIPVDAVTQASVQEFERLLTDWMFNNLQPNGRMTYLYYPSTDRENSGNNMIRQWMGTVSMGRAARIHPERKVEHRVEQNIRYNLKQFYRTEGELGYIEYRNMAKLGAAALAMISLIESPERAQFAEQEAGLFRLTEHLWQPSGRFNTFYKPTNRNDEGSLHNFYPGEALLAWSFLYEQNKSKDLLDKSMKSFRHYKDWHLANRNPAFIPWHTQAYYTLWKHTQSEDLRDWVFEMNDWLVDVMQTHSRVGYDDTIGRFYTPRQRFGVPHASSTGVYLEGLIDAFALARKIGDKHHEEKYRKSIILGLRSSMQLQFQDNIDMFYSSQKHKLRGGMRTTVYENEIRVDNVQHVLMGVQKIIREFKKEDYQFSRNGRGLSQ